MNKVKALDATLHLFAKHLWRVLQSLRFPNPLGHSKADDTAYALLVAAIVPSKAVRPYAQEPRFDINVRPHVVCIARKSSPFYFSFALEFAVSIGMH